MMVFCERCSWDYDDTKYDECPDCKGRPPYVPVNPLEVESKPKTKPSMEVEERGR